MKVTITRDCIVENTSYSVGDIVKIDEALFNDICMEEVSKPEKSTDKKPKDEVKQ